MPITTKTTQRTTRRLGFAGLTVMLIATACGAPSATEPITAAAPAPSLAEAEDFVDTESTVEGAILHMTVLHRSCRELPAEVIRCVWAETSPVHELYGWGHDFVTQEFTGVGEELVPEPRVVTPPATSSGALADHLTLWVEWLGTYHPELASAVTPGLDVHPDVDLDDVERAYWQYMAFIGAISLCGLPGAPSCDN